MKQRFGVLPLGDRWETSAIRSL